MQTTENPPVSLNVNGTMIHFLRDAQDGIRLTISHRTSEDDLTAQITQMSLSFTPAQALVMVQNLLQITSPSVETLQRRQEEQEAQAPFKLVY